MKNQLILFLVQKSAKLVLNFYKPKVILISGTLGKTSTKDLIGQVFKTKYSVRKTSDNANNEFGVAYTILGIEQSDRKSIKLSKLLKILLLSIFKIKFNYPEVLVIEVGSRKPGDIKNSVYYLRPDVAVITKISNTPSHIEYFKNLEELAKEEFSSSIYLKEGGKIVCFAEDVKYLEKKQHASVVCVSTDPHANCNRLLDWDLTYKENNILNGSSFVINVSKVDRQITCKNGVSRSYAIAFVFALTVYELFDKATEVNLRFISEVQITKGRSGIVKGKNGSIIIDDSYNASPDSVMMALDGLDKIKCRRKFVVLGEMLELGDYTRESHIQILEKAKKITNEIYLMGKAFKDCGETVFASPREIGDLLYKKLEEGDIILVKGSQGNRLEIAIQLMSKFQKNVTENLVRQTKFWRDKQSLTFAKDNVPFYDQNTLENWQQKGLSSEKDAEFWNIRACGISCVKMISEAFGAKKVDIGTLINEAVLENAYKKDVGWIHAKLANFVTNKFDLYAKDKRKVSLEYIKTVLENGGLVIASVGFGFHRGKSGHLVVILGYEIHNSELSGFYVHHPSTKKELCLIREYVPIKKFENSFSGNIIEIKNKT